MNAPGILALDRNEYFFPHPAPVRDALSRAAQEAHRYTPATTHAAFHSQVAEFLEVEPGNVILGHGGEDLLVKILAWQRRWKEVLLLVDFSWQTYAQIGGGFAYALKEAPCRRVGARFETPLEPLAAILRESAPAVVILTTPNNPTGHSLKPSDVENLADAFPQHTFLIDAVYDSPRNPFVHLATTRGNLILLGSFSKFFGLPGIRVGYAVSPALPSGMNLVLGLQPFAVAAAQAALEHVATYAAHREEMLSFARTLVAASRLPSAGPLQVYETHAPFLLTSLPGLLAGHAATLEALVVEHAVRPKIFERQGETWLRFGLGPREAQTRTRAFLESLASPP